MSYHIESQYIEIIGVKAVGNAYKNLKKGMVKRVDGEDMAGIWVQVSDDEGGVVLLHPDEYQLLSEPMTDEAIRQVLKSYGFYCFYRHASGEEVYVCRRNVGKFIVRLYSRKIMVEYEGLNEVQSIEGHYIVSSLQLLDDLKYVLECWGDVIREEEIPKIIEKK